MTWWESLEQYLDERAESDDDDAPDPWGNVELGDLALTDEQIAYLGFDQPEPPRFRESAASRLDDQAPSPSGSSEREAPSPSAGEGTGNSPGDD